MNKKISDLTPSINYKGHQIKQMGPDEWIVTIKEKFKNCESAKAFIDKIIPDKKK